MAYELKKPCYSNKERADFIVFYNHIHGLRIEETEDTIFALEVNEILKNGKPVIDKTYKKRVKAEETEKRKQEIEQALNELDTKRIRAICEPSIKDEETGETWLEYYNNEVIKLREELTELQEG